MSPIRILIADDHSVIRTALALLLDTQPDMLVVGQATNGTDAVEKAAALKPDVVLMDLTMPGVNGIEATQQILAQNAAVRIIGLSFHEANAMAVRMQEAGAVAYLSKSAPPAELMSAIRAARTAVVLEQTVVETPRDDGYTIARGMTEHQRQQFLALAAPSDNSNLETVSEEILNAFWSMGLVYSSKGTWELTDLGERVLAVLSK